MNTGSLAPVFAPARSHCATSRTILRRGDLRLLRLSQERFGNSPRGALELLSDDAVALGKSLSGGRAVDLVRRLRGPRDAFESP